VLALDEDIKGFLAASEPGKRSADLAKLKELAQSFTKTSVKIADLIKPIESANMRAAVQAGLDGILRSAFMALGAEVAAEQNRVWRERVAQPVTELCAHKYPFDAEATAEVPLSAFAKAFNPTSGPIWNAIRPIENLRTVQALGTPLLPVTTEYERLVKRINDLKALCFDGNSETLALPFTLTLVGRAEVKDLNFAFGDQSISLYDVPDARFQIRIKEGKPAVAKVAISVVTGQWMTRDFKGEWAFLRLLREGKPVVRPEGNYTCNWLFESKSGSKTQYTATALIEANGIEKALIGDLFTGFICPDAITPPPANVN
jgi:type VI protein secretion system component VasK